MVSNFPKLSNRGRDALLLIYNQISWWDRMILLDCPARRELRKAGLIKSEPPNANPYSRSAVGGHYYRWRMTPFGVDVAEAYRREIDA